jgi:hypothetical protein
MFPRYLAVNRIFDVNAAHVGYVVHILRMYPVKLFHQYLHPSCGAGATGSLVAEVRRDSQPYPPPAHSNNNV